MYRLKNLNLLSIVLSCTLAVPVFAHKVEISKNVGATIHIEPNDTPKAGKPSLTWFALTRKGGKVIPLDKCQCQLEVYAKPYTKASQPVAKPTLKAISAEGYQGIPGAEITFPRAGGYQLILKGSPKVAGDFSAFELSFSINVAR